jgi:hypothetical protein
VKLIKTQILPLYRKIPNLKIITEKDLSVAEANHAQSSYYKNTDSKSAVISVEYQQGEKRLKKYLWNNDHISCEPVHAICLPQHVLRL